MKVAMVSKNFFNKVVVSTWVLLAYFFVLVVGCDESRDYSSNVKGVNGSEPRIMGTKELYYFTWSDYVDQELLDGFEEKTGIKVMVDTFSSNEELLAKVQSGATGYDVVVPSDFMVSIMARQGLLAKLNRSRIPNDQFIEPFLKNLPFDPDQEYAVPYFWGTVGIGYDSNVIREPPTSWDILWDPKYKGRGKY